MADATAPFDGIEIIDTMVGFPKADRREVYRFLDPHLRDKESKEEFTFPAQYMFNDIPPELEDNVDTVAVVLDNLDRFGVAQAMVGVRDDRPDAVRALRDHPDRFLASVELDPNGGMDTIRYLMDMHERFGVVAATTFPAGYQVPINDKRYYPIYAKCVELDIPIFVCAGVPGPRVPMAPQKVELIDEVCWFFPELTFVMRHGAQPWCDLAVKLMLKWPNLYYSTSAFAPKHYDRAIIDYANTRGADKVLYAGYFPAGLTYDRIWGDMPSVPFKDEVWPKFLRDNARTVLRLDR
ncbi:MAG: amidohydrolase family protein [Acidimicrobiales bacterium]|nr:amidohydrolase family protein [Acidimicrobiales bacterium]MCB1261134.1 amidohydrolase family protein [Acidimicrobiales bacterium]